MPYEFKEPSEIKLIILYLIKSFNGPLDNGQITDLFMYHSFVDYFTMQEYLDEMDKAGLVDIYMEDGVRKYILTGLGQNSLEFFADRLPKTVRERLLMSVRRYQKRLKNQLEVQANYHAENELEYMMDCAIYESGVPLLTLKISAGSKDAAMKMAARFKEEPQKIYSEIIRLLTE